MSSDITLSDLIPTIREVVNAGNEATFIPNGKSMRPFLEGGRDKIVLVKASFPLKKYDVPLYVRDDGSIVLHRVIKVTNTTDGPLYFFRGDNTWETEEGITNKHIVAMVSKFCRKGKWHSVKDKGYLFYCAFWCKTFSVRKFLFLSLSLFKRAVRKFIRIIKNK